MEDTNQTGTGTCFDNLQQKLFFVIGKGGVGRTTISSSLAAYFSQKKEKVLLVQWALSDCVSPVFHSPAVGHSECALPFSFANPTRHLSFHTMNFNADEAIKEYFVDHLKMKLLYSFVIQNKHVQKLIHAAPGVSELFFLGRLFWLVELSQKERGFSYDRIIVDAPATGHGVSLFGIAKAVASLGITGPLALECERVSRLLSDPQKTALLFATLPEELPVEECLESIPKVTQKLGFSPQMIIVNQSIQKLVSSRGLNTDALPPFLGKSDFPKQDLSSLVSSLLKRNLFESKLQKFANENKIPLLSIPDFNLVQKEISPLTVIDFMSQFFVTGEVR